ncbi:2-haloalkanoic acid dehalogenase type II [Undibacterium sp. GrIS 1.8]|uniref:HAD family hydrolase n=1 Tax=Undibacterium sp. GrIS 1.8 TaxID=3143934 RepID=UPI003390A60F
MSSPKIKAVLFDLDDTLWPVAPVIQYAEASLYQWMMFNTPEVAQHYSIDRMRSYREKLVKTNPRFQYDLWSLRHALLSKLFLEFKVDVTKADEAMAVFADARNKVSLYDDVVPGLQALSKRVELGSISNGFADLHVIGLAPHFKVSLAAHKFGCAKPDPRIFSAACNALDLPPEQVMYVGDDLLLDVEGAQRAGMQGVWMNRHQVAQDKPHHAHIKPDAVVASVHDVLAMFLA